MRKILINHNQRYPRWTIEDVYKLIHQAALGSEHALKDKNRARERLVREMAELSPGPEEPLIDTISPDGQVVRVHLRPYSRLQLDGQLLLEAFLCTANHCQGSTVQAEEFYMTAVRLAQEGTLPFPDKDMQGFLTKMKTAAFPPVHHSSIFRTAYQPAYRVVELKILPPEILTAVQLKNLGE